MGKLGGTIQHQIELAKELIIIAPSFRFQKPLVSVSNLEKEDVETLLYLIIPVDEFIKKLEGG